MKDGTLVINKLRSDLTKQAIRIDAATKKLQDMGRALTICVEILGELSAWKERYKAALVVDDRAFIELHRILKRMEGVFKTYVAVRT